jgi:hypothetical protein
MPTQPPECELRPDPRRRGPAACDLACLFVFVGMLGVMIPVTRDELISSIAYAIGCNLRLLPNRREHLAVEASRALAEAVVKYLELCKREVYRPEPWHSSPPTSTRPD